MHDGFEYRMFLQKYLNSNFITEMSETWTFDFNLEKQILPSSIPCTF